MFVEAIDHYLLDAHARGQRTVLSQVVSRLVRSRTCSSTSTERSCVSSMSHAADQQEDDLMGLVLEA